MHKSFDFVKKSGGISEFTHKKNGLRVLHMEDTTSPVVGLMVTYHVGSRNEVTGNTGATHLLEHLLFKSSKKHKLHTKTSIDRILHETGAIWNATTYLDRTNYYQVVRKADLDRVASFEGDRMRHSLFSEEDRVTEMPVVMSEYEIGENRPDEALEKILWSTAFVAHPYHHSTIGWLSDIQNVSIERLRQFYDTFYWPNNATVTLVGDIAQNEALVLVDRHFGVHPASPTPIPEMYTKEPPQEGKKHAEVCRPTGTNIVGIAHKVPRTVSPETYALNVLESILAEGKNSRLNRALVEKKMATSVSSTTGYPLYDGSLFTTTVNLSKPKTHDSIRDIVLKEYALVAEKGVTEKEVRKAIASYENMVARSRDGAFAVLSSINEFISAGDWTFYTTYMKGIKKVTPQDVQEVAKKYFVENNMTTGYFIGD